MLAPPTKTIITRNMSERFDIMWLILICASAICVIVTTLASGSRRLIFATRPLEISWQQPITSMALMTGPFFDKS